MPLINREAVLKILEAKYCDQCSGDMEELIQEVKSLPTEILDDGWIKLADKKPEESGRYIVYDGDDVCRVGSAFYDKHDNWWGNYTGITHYKPLPNPPTK